MLYRRLIFLLGILLTIGASCLVLYSYFKKGCWKNVHATISKGNMGYDQYTVPGTVAVESTFVAFLLLS